MSGVEGASGVATSPDGRYLAYTFSEGGPPPEAPYTGGGLKIRGPNGPEVTASTLAYEQEHNPDQHIRYGVANVFRKLTVHRGMYHSIPAMLVAGLCVYLAYHSADRGIDLFAVGDVR